MPCRWSTLKAGQRMWIWLILLIYPPNGKALVAWISFKWVFPEVGVPLNHPSIAGIFHCKPSSHWGTPMTMEIPKSPSHEQPKEKIVTRLALRQLLAVKGWLNESYAPSCTSLTPSMRGVTRAHVKGGMGWEKDIRIYRNISECQCIEIYRNIYIYIYIEIAKLARPLEMAIERER